MASSKTLLLFVLLAAVLFISSEMAAARELAEQIEEKRVDKEVAEKAKYYGGGYHGGGGNHGGSGYHGGGESCKWGCCNKGYHGNCKCCASPDEIPDAEFHAKPRN